LVRKQFDSRSLRPGERDQGIRVLRKVEGGEPNPIGQKHVVEEHGKVHMTHEECGNSGRGTGEVNLTIDTKEFARIVNLEEFL